MHAERKTPSKEEGAARTKEKARGDDMSCVHNDIIIGGSYFHPGRSPNDQRRRGVINSSHLVPIRQEPIMEDLQFLSSSSSSKAQRECMRGAIGVQSGLFRQTPSPSVAVNAR
jgi:hypothetical protein